MPYLLFLSCSLSLFILSFSSLSLVCHLADTDTPAELYTSSTLSSPWGRLGILRHIRNPTVRSPFDTKFIHLITRINLSKRPLLFRYEPLGRLVSSQRWCTFVIFSLVWNVWNVYNMWHHKHRTQGSVSRQKDLTGQSISLTILWFPISHLSSFYWYVLCCCCCLVTYFLSIVTFIITALKSPYQLWQVQDSRKN